MVGQATAMPYTEFKAILEEKMKRGLMGRAFWVQPVGPLLKDVRDQLIQNMPDLARLTTPTVTQITPLVHPELEWRSTLAPGYSIENAPRVTPHITRHHSRGIAQDREGAIVTDQQRDIASPRSTMFFSLLFMTLPLYQIATEIESHKERYANLFAIILYSLTIFGI